MSIKKTVTATNHAKLVDLNGETTNFELTFNATSKDNSEFEVVVVDQNTLDNNPDLEFRPTSGGTMSANIISDKDVYQNYFLVLRAVQPTEVDIIIRKKEIPPNSIHLENSSPQQQQQQYIPQEPIQQPKQTVIKNKGWSTTKILFIVLIVAVGGFLLYNYLFKKKVSNHVVKSTTKDDVIPSIEESPITHSVSTFSTDINNTPPSKEVIAEDLPIVDNNNFTFKGDSDLMNRINNLSMLKKT